LLYNLVVKDRSQLILDLLERQGTASYEDIAKMLKVSNMTIRRECDALAQSEKIIKTVGGIQRADAPAYFHEGPVDDRLLINHAEKQAIARKSLELIGEQHTIYIDGSTTCLELAKLMARERSGLTVVTNSVMICLEMSRGRNTIIGIGGEFDQESLSFGGSQAAICAKTFFVDLAIVSTKAFLPADGTYESLVATFRIKQIMAEQCSELVLLVDHTKFGKRSLSKVLDISQIHHVVTDDKTSKSDISLLEGTVRKVTVATIPSVDWKNAIVPE
jgi:DeoR family transcriptional regulator, aga operon transcriptional repressor